MERVSALRDASAQAAPGISVVVPNYNHAAFLRQRIETILAQTYQDFELILLDDASTDDSRAVLEEYASDGRVRMEFNEANSGSPFKQWNKGVRLARGKYVWIAESDDYADARLLETLAAMLEADEAVAFAYCRSWRVTENGAAGFADYNLPDSGRWEADFCADGAEFFGRYFAYITPVPNASAVVFRKSVYESVGGADESLRLCGDWKLFGSMALRGKVAYCGAPLNYFRYHGNNARSNVTRNGRDAAEFLRVTRWVLEQVTLPDAALRKIRRARAIGWVPAVLSLRTPPELRKEIWESVRAIDPHPARRFLGPALATLRRKIARHSREVFAPGTRQAPVSSPSAKPS
jgi:glycosyltransferase involved in cell wall biosynthesis